MDKKLEKLDKLQEQIDKMIKDSPRKKCKCGCEHFDTATVQLEVSAVVSGTGKNETLLVGVLVCRKCGEENSQSKIIS